MERMPGPVCLPVKFSSANLAPYMLRHPVPSPCGALCPWSDACKYSIVKAACSCSHLDKIAPLDHEAFDDSVEAAAFVANWLHITPA